MGPAAARVGERQKRGDHRIGDGWQHQPRPPDQTMTRTFPVCAAPIREIPQLISPVRGRLRKGISKYAKPIAAIVTAR
jgi:hypothetical protein